MLVIQEKGYKDKTVPKTEKEGKLPNPFYDTSIALISKPDKKLQKKKDVGHYP